MSDLSTERAHFAQAERHIAEGEARIFKQEELVARLRAGGRGSAEAEALLRNLRDTLQTWKAHRQQIVQALGTLEN